MPIRQDDHQPNRRFGIVNIILIGVGALLLFSSLFPNQNMQIPRVPYSLFIEVFLISHLVFLNGQ